MHEATEVPLTPGSAEARALGCSCHVPPDFEAKWDGEGFDFVGLVGMDFRRWSLADDRFRKSQQECNLHKREFVFDWSQDPQF